MPNSNIIPLFRTHDNIFRCVKKQIQLQKIKKITKKSKNSYNIMRCWMLVRGIKYSLFTKLITQIETKR